MPLSQHHARMSLQVESSTHVSPNTVRTAIMTAVAIVLLAGAAPIVAIFDIPLDTPLANLSIEWMRILGAGMPIVGVHIALIGMLRGAGATGTSLRINIVGTALQVPLSWLLGFPLGLGPFGVWVAFPLSFVIKMLLGIAAYRKGDWVHLGETA